jgi:hypothetical protein
LNFKNVLLASGGKPCSNVYDFHDSIYQILWLISAEVFKIGVASTFVNKKKNTDMKTIPTPDSIIPALFLVSPIVNKNAMNKIMKKTAERAFIDFTPA